LLSGILPLLRERWSRSLRLPWRLTACRSSWQVRNARSGVVDRAAGVDRASVPVVKKESPAVKLPEVSH